MSKPPPHSDRRKMPELSPPFEQNPRQKAAKHPRPWNSGMSPSAKGRSTASPTKQPSKQAPRRPQQNPPKQTPKQLPKQLPKELPKKLPKQTSKQPPKQPAKLSSNPRSTPQNTGKTPPASVRSVHEQSTFQRRDYETAANLGSPGKKILAPILKETKAGLLPGGGRSPTKDDEYFSSLLKRSSLNLSPPSKVSNTYDKPSQNDKDPGFDQICDNKAPVSGIPSSDFEARCFFRPRFIAESDEEQDVPPRFTNETVVCGRMQPSRRTGKLRSPVGTPEDESHESWLPTDHAGGDWQAWRPPEPIPMEEFRRRFRTDSVEELRGVPMRATIVREGEVPPARQMEAIYPNPEAHILAIDPDIIIHAPRSRRSLTMSDPVYSTASRHEESLNYQARQYYTVLPNDDHAFQMMPKGGSQYQDSKSTGQPADQESAYQEMLKKAHYKPDQTHQLKSLQAGMRRESEKREKDAPFSRIVIEKDAPEEDPKIVMEPTPATIGRYLQPSSQNIIRPNGSISSGVAGRSHKAKPKKGNTTRNSRVPYEPSPEYTPIREPLSPNKHSSLGGAKSSYTSGGWHVGQKVQQKLDGKASSPRPSSNSKSTQGSTENGNHSVPAANSPLTSSPRRTQNKSVSWDPAITLIGPVISHANERPTAEALFERLLMEDVGNGVAWGEETGGDKDVDAFVSTFKRWKKGDRSKLDSLLKALRDIEADIDTDSANEEKVNEDMQNNAPGQNTITGFDPRVPDFKPFIFRENEIWVQKVRSHTPVTLSELASRPIAPATINIPFRAAFRGRPPWPTPGKFENVVLPYQRPVRVSTRPNWGGGSQPIKKRVIWDNPEDLGGREAVMQSQRWAGELLEQFTKKYPLTGQKAAIVPKKRLEDLPISRPNSNTLKVAKMVSNAADIQQKLEVLLMQKKEAKARGIR